MKITKFLLLIFIFLPCLLESSEKVTPENFVPKLREKFSEYVNEKGYLIVPSPTLAYIFHKGSEKLIKNLLWNERNIQLCLPQVLLNYVFKVSVEVIEKEIEYCNKGYFVFYHGQRLDHRLLQDLKEIFYEESGKKKLNDFVFVRQADSPNLENINKFKHTDLYIKHFFKKYGSDDCPEVSETLLPANCCFFGNSLNIGESSFAYFILKMLFPTRNIMDYIFVLFLQYDKYVEFERLKDKLQELVILLNNENSKDHTDNLLQIFIPHKLANLVYFSLPYGYKKKCNCIKNILSRFCSHKNVFDCNCDFDKLCHRYQIQNHIDIKTLDSDQLRILLKPKYFMNPESKVKIFRYANNTEQLKKYNDKFEEIKEELVQRKQYFNAEKILIHSKL